MLQETSSCSTTLSSGKFILVGLPKSIPAAIENFGILSFLIAEKHELQICVVINLLSFTAL